ncbi:MAG: hypothetical protein GBAus27B_000297 [Mycoplasmataceae bacterium]|nr:MAG: hypothetical protein GBAus27B_000297 [Mycoplasmataceae bacterium]
MKNQKITNLENKIQEIKIMLNNRKRQTNKYENILFGLTQQSNELKKETK